MNRERKLHALLSHGSLAFCLLTNSRKSNYIAPQREGLFFCL
nr:MAG TPA: hypothetical protein [Caudoviricetes sp.]